MKMEGWNITGTKNSEGKCFMCYLSLYYPLNKTQDKGFSENNLFERCRKMRKGVGEQHQNGEGLNKG